MKPFKFLFAAFAVFMAFACTPQEEIDSLTMGSTEINVSYEGEEKTLEFTTNTAWKIESDSDWVTFDVEEGLAGEATVVMTVAANTTYEARTAAVTITAGTLFTEYVINQGFATEFGAGMEYNLDFLPQVLEIALNTNADYEVSVSEDAASWITSDAITKAAPVKESVIFSVALNSGEERSGEIYIKAGNITQTIVVNQTAFEGTVMTSVEELTYLGKTSLIYDEVNYEFPMFDEHFLSLTNEKGDALTLALNNEVLEDAMSALPAGEYLPDASGAHEASTFTLYDGKTGYFTSATLNGVEVNFFDGLVSVEVNEKVYKIIADLYDATGAPYSFAFIGELPEMEDKSYGLDATVKFEGQYETYFTTKAKKFSLQFYAAKKSEGVDQFVRSMNISIYAPENADPAVLPVGTYTFAEPANSADLTWANGIKLAEPNMMTYFYGSDDSYAGLSASEGSKVTISKNADGTYKFAFDLTLSGGYWDYETDPNGTYVEIAEFDYAVEYDNVKVGEVVSDIQKITLNGDDVFSTVMSPQYVGMWWGDKWATGGSAFTVGFSGASVNNVYEIYLTINQSKEYVYEKNMAGKYCSTPLETGVYTFAKTPVAGQRNIVPAKYGSNVYSYVKNSYTGTKMPICGGSLTLNNDSIEFNLEVADGDKVYKMTGTIGATLYYARDYTKNAKNLGLIE